jgi:hypothetical protein
MIKEYLVMGSTKSFSEVSRQERVIFSEKDAKALMSVLNEMGVVVSPSRAVVMTQEDS